MISGREKFMQRMKFRMKNALDALGEDSVERIKKSLDTPAPPHSEPNAPPHKETGELHAGISHSTSQTGPFDTTTRVSSSDPKSTWLEYGTEGMSPRPFLRPEIMRLRFQGSKRLVQTLRVSGTNRG